MNPLEPLLPDALPPDFTHPSAGYRRLTWLVSACLVGLAVFYVALVALLADDLRLTWQLTQSGSGYVFFGWVFAPLALVLLWLLLSALFQLHGRPDLKDVVELTADREPGLFALIAALADRTGAPRPHRVFLVPGVNAAVAYEASLLNLLLPTKKNLFIGLGLVNALTVGQLTAVLAHEFGHFSQSSMRLGRWVYVASGIITRVVSQGTTGRSLVRASAALDWRLAIVVAAYAVAVDLARRAMLGLLWLVHLPERALSREMELHADKVAVSLTGSDALVEALAKIRLADIAYEQLGSELRAASTQGRFARDIYPLHEAALQEAERSNPDLALPAGHERPDPARRLFAGDDTPPHMWASHPPGRIREESAKSPYIPAARDDRPAKVLFSRWQEQSESLSQAFNRAYLEMKAGAEISADPRSNRALSGLRADIYGHFFVTSRVTDPESLIEGLPEMSDETLLAELAGRHGPAARAPFESQRVHERELRFLRDVALGNVPLSAALRFRGQRLESGQASKLAAEVRDALVADIHQTGAIHARARALCRAAAIRLGEPWVDAHRDALALLHRFEHEVMRMGALSSHFVDLLQAVADGDISESKACEKLFSLHSFAAVSRSRIGAVRSEPLCPSGPPPLSEGRPIDPPDILSWTPAWVGRFDAELSAMRHATGALLNAALEHLLDLEDRIEAEWIKACAGERASEAPKSSLVLPPFQAHPIDPSAPYQALTFPSGRERSDIDYVSQTVKSLAAAAVVLIAPLLVWLSLHRSEVVLYNGTGASLDVLVGSERYTLSPKRHRRVGRFSLWPARVATEYEGEILEETRLSSEPLLVYNAARRGVLVEGEIVYSADDAAREAAQRDAAEQTTRHGNPLLSTSRAEFLFDELPSGIQSSERVATRRYLLDVSDREPAGQLVAWMAEGDMAVLCTSALRFDPPGPLLETCAVLLALADPERAQTMTASLRERHPESLDAHRIYQNVRAADPALVEEYRLYAEREQTAAGWYLYGRLLEGDISRQMFDRALALEPLMPRASFAVASLDAQEGRWDLAEQRLSQIVVLGDLREPILMLRLRARREMGERGFPPALVAELPEHMRLLEALLEVDESPSEAAAWVSRAPDFEPELWLSAGEIERAKAAIAERREASPDTALVVALSGPAAGWPAALEAAGGLSPPVALLGAVASHTLGLPSDRFLAGLGPDLAAVATALSSGEPLDLPALKKLAREVDAEKQWAVYAAAVLRDREARPPEIVEIVRALSMPWEAPRW